MDRLIRWLSQIRCLLRRRRLDDDARREFAEHLERLTARHISAGMTRDEAVLAARRQFGNATLMREEMLGMNSVRWFESLARDLRGGVRTLAKNPGFSAVVVLTLALGIGASIAIFSVIDTALLHPLPLDRPNGLISLRESKQPQFPDFTVSPGNFLAWQAQNRTFDVMGAFMRRGFNVSGAGEAERLPGAFITGDLFDVLGVHPVAGRGFTPDDDRAGAPPVVLLSYGLWQRRFGGDPAAIGRAIVLNGAERTIVGVMPAAAQVLAADAALFVPLVFTEQQRQQYGSHYLQALGRLKPGVGLSQARADLDIVARRLEADHPADDAGWRVLADPLEQRAIRDVRPALLLLLAAVGLVLLVACANVANLQLARGVSRQKELAVRAALGAGRGQLVRQLLAESLVTALAGAAVGLMTAGWMLRTLLALAPTTLPRAADIGVNVPAVSVAIALGVLTMLLFGLLPAMQVSRVDLRDAIAEGGRSGQPSIRRRTRRAFVVVEIAMATLLLMGSGLLVRSFLRLARVDPGFVASGAFATDVALPQTRYRSDADVSRFFQQLLDRVARLPGVTAGGITETLPLDGSTLHDLTIDDRPPVTEAAQPAADYYTVSPGYFAAMGMRLLRGRLFTEQDRPDTPRVAVISETFATELFPGEDPLGRRVKVTVDPDTWREIVGIVGDTKQYGLAAAATKQFYEPFEQAPNSGGALVVRATGDPGNLATALRGVVHDLDPNVPIGPVRTLDSMIAQSVAPQRFSMLLLGTFAVSALFLAAIGLYSVIAYSVSQRTREVGIRVAHGAQRGDVVWLVLREGLSLALAGLVVGLAGSLAAGQLMASLLFGVTATDPLTAAAVLLGLLAVAALACVVPAYRAALVDPIVALRSA